MPRSIAIRNALFLLFPLAASLVASAQVPKDFRPGIAVLQSPASEGVVTEARAREALWYAAADLKLAPENLPRVIVVHAPMGTAQIAKIPTSVCANDRAACGATLTENTEDGGKLYYLWIIGKASDVVLVRGIVQILQAHAGVPDTQLAAVTRRVLAHMKATVAAEDLLAG